MNSRALQALRAVMVALACVALVVALGGGSQAQATSAPALTVGILHVGSKADRGYNQAHAEGIRIMQKNMPGVKVIQVENVPEGADAERVMEQMIRQGAKFIIPASFGYLDPAINVARKFPDVKFEHPGGYRLAPNLGTYWASTQDAFYIMGVAAGQVTKTNKMGFIMAFPISFFLANVNAFHLGARSVNPKVETRVVITGTFLDPGKEATAANALIDQGVDVLAMIVDSPITITTIAEKRGAHTVGYHFTGLQRFAPKGWISGVAFTWGPLYTRFVKQVMDGTWKSERKFYGLDSDTLTVAPFGPSVTPAAARRVQAVKQALINGQVQIFAGPIRDNRGVLRVEAGRALSADDYGRMDWLAEGIIGEAR